jgi:ABC-2 type transport system permease protein
MDWSSLSNMLTAGALMAISLWRLVTRPENPVRIEPMIVVLYVFYVLCGVAILYSIMIGLASTSIWLGRNQSLYDFWFYITNFSRYPMEIYYRGWGKVLWVTFTFVIPVLVVVNVPARLLARPLSPRAWWEWPLAGFAVVATLASLFVSRWIFQRALRSYRSASS